MRDYSNKLLIIFLEQMHSRNTPTATAPNSNGKCYTEKEIRLKFKNISITILNTLYKFRMFFPFNLIGYI